MSLQNKEIATVHGALLFVGTLVGFFASIFNSMTSGLQH